MALHGIPLQGEETFEFVPDSQFTVSRTAHRNNSSDYYIDDKKSNFTEVTKLLKSKGIDLDNNRFLILQVCLHMVSRRVICSMHHHAVHGMFNLSVQVLSCGNLPSGSMAPA